MSNLYYESESTVAKLRSGEIPIGSIIKVQWPSGNSEAVRVHGWSKVFDKLIGCNMGWDNAATELYELSAGIVSLLEKPRASQFKQGAVAQKRI